MSETLTVTPALPISESFLIACIGVVAGMCGGFLTCILRSRCIRIKCCGIECERQLPDTQPDAIEVRAIGVNR